MVLSECDNWWFYQNHMQTLRPGKKYVQCCKQISMKKKMTLVKNAEKVIKINPRIITKAQAYLQTMRNTPVNFQRDPQKNIEGDAHTRYPLYIHTLVVFRPEKWLGLNAKKSEKINLRIISKPHAHLQTMPKIFGKFQKDRHKTIGGVAYTRYPLSIHFGGDWRMDGCTDEHSNVIIPRHFLCGDGV